MRTYVSGGGGAWGVDGVEDVMPRPARIAEAMLAAVDGALGEGM